MSSGSDGISLSRIYLWGNGKAKREFQYVDDLADACAFAIENVTADDVYGDGATHLNVGTGEESVEPEFLEVLDDGLDPLLRDASITERVAEIPVLK
mgnify:CR=1 FL=1